MRQLTFILGIALIFSDSLTCIDAKVIDMGGSFVVSAENNKSRQKRSIESSMTEMHVKSVVKSRFAKVTTTTIMENSAEEAKELTFSVRLPEAAFISKFTMNVDGTLFVGKVKEKAVAKQEYEGAVKAGNSAGLVTTKVRETQTFNVAANVPPQARVVFELEYQELLKRRLGKYEQVLFINPGQIVDDLSLNVYITEEIGISTLEAHHPQGGEMKYRRLVIGGYDSGGEVDISVQIRRSKHQASVSFKPNQAQQRRLLMIPEDERRVSVVYDVTRENLGGELLTRDGYFVHFFAPENLPVLPKKVVFVIDQSGSMYGKKMSQTKTAFETVLRGMSDADEFNIVTFSNDAHVWKSSGLVPVTEMTVEQAVHHVKRISASGSTNLNDALLKAVEILGTTERRSDVLTTIIALTDGDPTVGVTNEKAIRENVKSSIRGAISLLCIGFGNDLNHDFLKKLSNDNDGVARKIYPDSDAHLQLEGFFQEVATPLLLNVNIRYIGMNIEDVSKSKIDKYFKGSEVVVVGTMLEQTLVEAQITGTNGEGNVEYTTVGQEIDEGFSHTEEDTGSFSNFIERLWAYSTINELLNDKVLVETQAEVDTITAKVTSLALKYNFVTPFTSMVVVLPEDEITTTAADSTVSPIPVCLRRGQEVPQNSESPTISCPYIFEGSRQGTASNWNSVASPRGIPALQPRMLSHHSRGRMRSGSRVSFMARRRRIGVGRKVASRARMSSASMNTALNIALNPYPSHDAMSAMSFADEDVYLPPPPAEPEVSSHCGGVLSSSEGTINLPSLQSIHSSRFHCDWVIEFPSGSWIDLYVGRIQTTSTKIKVTSGNEEIFRHRRGRYGPKYFSITTNILNIRMTVDPTETGEEHVTITYRKFVNTSIADPISDQFAELPATPTCGYVISSGLGQGTISSPNYPAAYQPNTFCEWEFAVDTNATLLSLHFAEVDIETNEHENCVADRVTVAQSSSSQTVCGIQNDLVIDVSPDSAHVIVTFKSNNAIEGTGFEMQYEYIER